MVFRITQAYKNTLKLQCGYKKGRNNDYGFKNGLNYFTTSCRVNSKDNFYEMDEVKKNKNENSAWIVIKNAVYDVTKFLDDHPGGKEPLLYNAGKDCTRAFEDVGHSTDARNSMKNFKIGELKK